MTNAPIFLFLQVCQNNFSAKALSKISRIIANENISTWFENLNFTAINPSNSFVIDDQTSGQLQYKAQDPIIGIDAKMQMLSGLTLFEYIHYLDSSIGSIAWENSLLYTANQELVNFTFNPDSFELKSDYSFLADPNDYNRNFMLYFYDLLSDVEAYNIAMNRFVKNATAAINYAEHLLWALIQSYNPVLVAPGRRSLRDSDDSVVQHVTQDRPPFTVREPLNENATAKREIHDWLPGIRSNLARFYFSIEIKSISKFVLR